MRAQERDSDWKSFCQMDLGSEGCWPENITLVDIHITVSRDAVFGKL